MMTMSVFGYFTQFCSQVWQYMSDAVVITDQDGTILQANPAFATLYRRSLSELVGNSLTDLYPVSARASARARYESLFASATDGQQFFTTHTFDDGLQVQLETFTFFEYEENRRVRMLSLIRNRSLHEHQHTIQQLQHELLNSRKEFHALMHEQKSLEQHLRDLQQKESQTARLLASIVQNFPNGAITVLDKTYHVVYADGTEYQKYGLNPKDLVGASLESIFPNKPLERYKTIYDRVFQGECHTFEFEYRGNVYQGLAVPLRNERGQIHHILSVALNITAQRRAEAERNAQAEQLATISSLIPSVIYQFAIHPEKNWAAYQSGDIATVTQTSRYTYMSPQAKAIFGISSEELVADMSKFSMLLLPEEFPSIVAEVHRCAQQMKAFSMQFKIRKPDGDIRWIQAYSLPTPDVRRPGWVVFNGIYLDVTDKRLLEENLHASKALTKALLNSTNDAIIAFDPDLRLTHFNSVVYDFYAARGIPLRVGMPLRDMVNPDFWSHIEQSCRRTLSGEAVHEEINYRITTQDPLIILEIFYNAVRDIDGNIIGGCIYTRDITKRKHDEYELVSIKQLLESQRNFFLSIIDNASDEIYVMNRKGKYMLFNWHARKALEQAGITIPDTTDIHALDLSPWLSPYLPYFQRALAGETFTVEERCSHANTWSAMTFFPVYDEQKNIIASACFVRDITHQKQLETELRMLNQSLEKRVQERTEQLYQSQRLYEAIARNFPNGMISIYDANLRLVFTEGMEYRRIGILPDTLVNKTVDEIYPPAIAAQLKPFLLDTFAGHQNRLTVDFGEAQYQYTATPLHDSDGAIHQVMVIVENITEQLKAEAQLKAAAEEKQRLTEKMMASQKLEAIGTLASGVAHEFNNIMAIISLAGEYLSQHVSDSVSQKQIALIRKTVERGASIVRQLLDFSRTEKVSMQPMNLVDVVSDVTSTLRRLLPKNISVSARLDADEACISGNDQQLYQVFLNLGINAGDAMPNGGELTFHLYTTTLSLDAQTQMPVVVTEVRDTGTGIPPEIRSRIFEPFFTTKGVGKGTGLGLSIVHGFVSAHQGSIELESEYGKGTVFKVILPLLNASPQSEQADTDAESLQLHANVLVVDDELFLRKTLSHLLRRHQLSVLEAEDGKTALQIFKKHKKEIDLVISDMGLPNMDGGQLLKQLFKLRPSLKAIAITGYLDSYQSEVLVQHNVRVLSKPFEISALIAAIKDLLSRDSAASHQPTRTKGSTLSKTHSSTQARRKP
jgi:PAS domain S-box-containing protein